MSSEDWYSEKKGESSGSVSPEPVVSGGFPKSKPRVFSKSRVLFVALAVAVLVGTAFVGGLTYAAGGSVVSTSIVGTQTVTVGVAGVSLQVTQTNLVIIQPALTLTSVTTTGIGTTVSTTITSTTTVSTTCTISVPPC